MTSEDCLVIILASPIYTGQDPNRCSKNHRLFAPSQQSAISGKPCANRLNPLFRDFYPYNAPILSIDLLHRKAFNCFHATPFLPNGLSRESVHNFCLGGSHRTSSRQECFICFSLRCSPLLHPWILNSSVLKTRMKFLNLPENNSLGVIFKTNSSLFKFAEKHQPWIFQKILSKCCESFIMEITYDGMHAWLVYSTWTDSRYVVVWEHFHLAIILWYSVALVDERWELFFNIRALKESFYRCFTWLCYC